MQADPNKKPPAITRIIDPNHVLFAVSSQIDVILAKSFIGSGEASWQGSHVHVQLDAMGRITSWQTVSGYAHLLWVLEKRLQEHYDGC